MGWSSGSQLAEDTWDMVREFIPEPKRQKLAKKFLKQFEDQDADDPDTNRAIYRDAGVYQNEDGT